MASLKTLRTRIRKYQLADEGLVLDVLKTRARFTPKERKAIVARATGLVENLRSDKCSGLLEIFLAEYSLSNQEGIALMCLAEALLRVPDAVTIDDLIEDKIAPSSWGEHLGHSSSSMVNASTWALMLTGKVLDEDASVGLNSVLHGAVKRLGEPVIRMAVKRAMKEMGNQFVLGETIPKAVVRAVGMEAKGFTYSYDMLGEAALTQADADIFFDAYWDAIRALSKHAVHEDIHKNPGISIKLSALHPRYEVGQKTRVIRELVPRTRALAELAKKSNMGLNIDAEEADRLDLSLDVIEAVFRSDSLADWDGFGIVVQAYGKRAMHVLDWVYALSKDLNRKLMVRLVKGAYWDNEIKRAQVEGLASFPVFTRKAATDISYMCCARQLLFMTDRVYPQFATHNAHTIAAILELAKPGIPFEFQRLHGMGEALHKMVQAREHTHCRIYAPVGAHRDLLAYLVRRLLENGANSSFVNQIIDEDLSAAEIVTDPFKTLDTKTKLSISRPKDLFTPERDNSRGWNLNDENDLVNIEKARSKFAKTKWDVHPLVAVPFSGTKPKTVYNPANRNDAIGTIVTATKKDVQAALKAAKPWSCATPKRRAETLNRAADMYEKNFGEIFAALAREAGKTPMDAITELREAVDFLRYYAAQGGKMKASPRGIISCISPWNFPLAIFTGQIAAALATGNGILAKPADPTPITAQLAVKLLHRAGVPKPTLQLLPGRGSVVGAAITSDSRVGGVCFTGSNTTARIINRAMAQNMAPDAPLIAETGGLNAMVVDSTALPEQAVKDIISSAFQSAGQRCSALRILYLQKDIVKPFLKMLFSAMDELKMGNPWEYSTDIGPVITKQARDEINVYIEQAKRDGRLLKQLYAPQTGTFVAPSAIKVCSIKDMKREIFGPVLHIATFSSHEIDKIISDINGSGYGLTFGLHTRIDDRVEHLTSQLHVGNMYVNRNQIGAIVGSQPFGGEGLSGTGPKAGGPHYIRRFVNHASVSCKSEPASLVPVEVIQKRLNSTMSRKKKRLIVYDLPGPTGESNRLSLYPKGTILCLGPSVRNAQQQIKTAQEQGCSTFTIVPGWTDKNGVDGFFPREGLKWIEGIAAVVLWSDKADLCTARQALAARDGVILPLITEKAFSDRCWLERHVCVDTTAAGGNASLLAANG